MRRGFLEAALILVLCLSLIGWLGLGGSRNLDKVLRLLRAGVGEEVIKAHIADENMTFELSTKDLVRLKKAGASDGLLAYMLGKESTQPVLQLNTGLVIGSPVVHRHLAVFPVWRRTPADVGDYLTLDEAQRARVILIEEHPSESVPTVVIRNIGGRPIYIIAGEIIIGGKQDRMISHDVLVPAGKEIEVSVRCVEHGRWRGKTQRFESGGALGSVGVRTALQFKNQQDVWNEVSKACEEHEAFSQSGTYGAILSNTDVENRSKPFMNAMKKGLKDKRMIGMVMALNGEIVCADIFAGPEFFAKVKEKLLEAYVLDAVSADVRTTEVPGSDDIASFFEEVKRAETIELKAYDENENYMYESDQIMGSESRDKEGRTYHLNLYRIQQ
jgi:hypothetical protein